MKAKNNNKNKQPLAKVTDLPTAASHEVGAKVGISDEDHQTITAAEQRVLALQVTLGQKLEEFEQIKQQLLQAINTARQEYVNVVATVARKHKINIDDGTTERWEFQRDNMQYTRVN